MTNLSKDSLNARSQTPLGGASTSVDDTSPDVQVITHNSGLFDGFDGTRQANFRSITAQRHPYDAVGGTLVDQQVAGCGGADVAGNATEEGS